ncbi:MAG TPA: 2-phospho-L-lactate transferase [Terriglobales bacterium]|nr:2-phospho-L-lactate transferase [Terriglobales bacterium]
MITVLTGGTGGAKFVWGLAQVLPPEQLAVIVNTGDDVTWWGLHVSPDLDSVMYALGGKLSRDRGWGYEDDSFRVLERMRSLGAEGWFGVGDLDLATHLRRTQLLSEGNSLTQATAELCRVMNVRQKLLPVSDDPVRTVVTTPDGDLSFQEYFVRERWKPIVVDVKFNGSENALTGPEVLQSIIQSEIVIIAPSNPVTSIGPILAVSGVCDALRCTTAQVIAISPIVGNAAVSGPAGEMLKMRGLPISAVGIAQHYRDLIDALIADSQDEDKRQEIETAGVPAVFTNTIMKSDAERIALAKFALSTVAPEAAR